LTSRRDPMEGKKVSESNLNTKKQAVDALWRQKMLKREFNRVLLTYREWQLNNCYNKHYLLLWLYKENKTENSCLPLFLRFFFARKQCH
jgi:hypothetical protein